MLSVGAINNAGKDESGLATKINATWLGVNPRWMDPGTKMHNGIVLKSPAAKVSAINAMVRALLLVSVCRSPSRSNLCSPSNNMQRRTCEQESVVTTSRSSKGKLTNLVITALMALTTGGRKHPLLLGATPPDSIEKKAKPPVQRIRGNVLSGSPKVEPDNFGF